MVRDILDVRQDGEAVLHLPAHRVPLTVVGSKGAILCVVVLFREEGVVNKVISDSSPLGYY